MSNAVLMSTHPEASGRVHAIPLRVLVVDDEPASRHALARALSEMGYLCETAADALQARAAHRAKPFDLILSDWMMPGPDGMELCRGIRADDGMARYTYFMLVTASSDKQHLVDSLRGGADEFVAKPIDLDELEARLIAAERVLRLHRHLAALNRSLKRDSRRFFRAARLDPLTSVPNRLQLEDDLPHFTARAAGRGSRACIAICDIDHFKIYNDSFGHPAGDEVLRRVSDAIRLSLRQSDSVYRYGGEEFLILLPKQSLSEAQTALGRVRHAVEALGIANPAAPGKRVTISIGVAEFQYHDATDPHGWIERADRALYRAKALGRNRCEHA